MDVQAQRAQESDVTNFGHPANTKVSHAHLVFESRHGGFDAGAPPIAISKCLRLFIQASLPLSNSIGGVLITSETATRGSDHATRLVGTDIADLSAEENLLANVRDATLKRRMTFRATSYSSLLIQREVLKRQFSL